MVTHSPFDKITTNNKQQQMNDNPELKARLASGDALVILQIGECDYVSECHQSIPWQLIVTSRKEWQDLGKLLKRHKTLADIEIDLTSGGGGQPMVLYNLYQLYSSAKILQVNPNDAVVDFVRQLDCRHFLDQLDQWKQELADGTLTESYSPPLAQKSKREGWTTGGYI